MLSVAPTARRVGLLRQCAQASAPRKLAWVDRLRRSFDRDFFRLAFGLLGHGHGDDTLGTGCGDFFRIYSSRQRDLPVKLPAETFQAVIVLLLLLALILLFPLQD